jgi:hypothetical protein
MYIVKNSPRALLVALIPLGLIHAVLVTMALLGAKANGTEASAPDQVLVFYVTRLAIDGALLFAGHWLLQQQRISSRIAYALMGGVMAAIGYAIAMRNSVQLSAPETGAVLSIGLLPTIAGMLAGFLYGQFAGLALVPGAATRTSSGAAAPRSFEGPVRVRTSVAGIAIAATMPAVLTMVFSVMAVSLLPAYFRAMTGGPGPTLTPVVAAAIPAQLFLAILVGTIVPSAIFILCVHHIARALHRPRALDYAATGAGMALICSIVLSPFAPIAMVSHLMIPAMICGAIMGALYRRFAGLEPLPLPEAVIATDPNALVSADHPSRREHSVILSN